MPAPAEEVWRDVDPPSLAAPAEAVAAAGEEAAGEDWRESEGSREGTTPSPWKGW